MATGVNPQDFTTSIHWCLLLIASLLIIQCLSTIVGPSEPFQVRKDGSTLIDLSHEREFCQLEKHAHVFFPKRPNKLGTFPFEQGHINVWLPITIILLLVSVSYIYQWFFWLYLDISYEATIKVILYFSIQIQFNITIHALQSNNAKEYIFTMFTLFTVQ